MPKQIPIIEDLDNAIDITNPKTTLKIYKAPAGHWCGILSQNDDEIGRIAGCENPLEVEEEAYSQGYTDLIILA